VVAVGTKVHESAWVYHYVVGLGRKHLVSPV